MEENGSLVQFIFNQDREVIAEQNSLGITRYIRSSELIARNTDAARTYYHYVSDEMGSTTHIVDEDGIVLNHYEYDAWGNLTAQEEAVPNRFKFTGQQLDPVTQQYYLRARFYNPIIARFTQEDTYRGDGLNLYAYCQNNPVFYADPSGTCSEVAKDPLSTPAPNQQQSTALVPYNPDFAAKQNALYGNGYANANPSLLNQSADTPLLDANNQVNQPTKPRAENSLKTDTSKTKIWDMPEGGAVINQREYSQHALERMAPDTLQVRAELSRRAERKAEQLGYKLGSQQYDDFCSKYVNPRNIPPSVVEDAITTTTPTSGNTNGTFIHETQDVKVIINSKGKVITVIKK